ncbi:MAG TPA: FHA domain-containing protein [Blastocatellia bacterium]|nr:FHA domain-containing protein [Blastocatellia bacterium]
MICPVCKAQNIDTAKFCGGCGTPMAKSAAPSPATSLVTCAQGHVYSSVYNACPYCPQSDRQVQSDFATRVEPVPENRPEPPPTVIQPDSPNQAPATVIEPSADRNRTGQMRRDYATVIDPSASGGDVRTGTLPDALSTQSVPIAPPPPKQPAPATVIEPVAPPPPPPPATVVPVTVAPTVVPPPPPTPVIERADAGQKQRRTVVVPNEGAVSPGRLVGWLVSFSQQPDGADYRLRAGRNVIGANPHCDIVIDDEAVSGTHASIVWRHGRCYLKDELSSNGTYLNGVEVLEPTALQSHDQIRVGNVMLTFISIEQ